MKKLKLYSGKQPFCDVTMRPRYIIHILRDGLVSVRALPNVEDPTKHLFCRRLQIIIYHQKTKKPKKHHSTNEKERVG